MSATCTSSGASTCHTTDAPSLRKIRPQMENAQPEGVTSVGYLRLLLLLLLLLLLVLCVGTGDEG